MRVRSRYPRVVSAACWVYGRIILAYPRQFRHAFERELALTFRNRVEDVLDDGGPCDWLAFAAHIAVDTLCTCRTLVASRQRQGAVSLLGLGSGEVAHGGLEPTIVDIHVVFVTAGGALTFGGWFAYFVILPQYVS